METIFYAIGGLVAVLILGVLIGGLLSPRHWEVSHSNEIPGKPEAVFQYIETLRRWDDWSAWNTRRYPKMQYTRTGPESGVGAEQRWAGNGQSGRMRITESVPHKTVVLDVWIGNNPAASNTRFTLEPRGEGAQVTWTMKGDAGPNPVSRLMMKLFKPLIQKDLVRGLDGLAALVKKEHGK